MVTVRNKLTGTTTSYSGASKTSTRDFTQGRIGGQKSTIGSTDANFVPGSFDPTKVRLNSGKDNSTVLDPNTGKTLYQGGSNPKGFTTSPETGTPQLEQPTPAEVSNNTSLVPYDQALKGLQNSGQSSQDIASATKVLNNKYQAAHQSLQGQPAPQDGGQGKLNASQVLNNVAPLEPDMSHIDTLMGEDKGWQQLLQTKEDFFNPENQKTSLMDTYNKLYKQSGLLGLDQEIIDAKTIIEGTEDDIRNEVEQAGGFATDSQVQAMSLARNKTLLKNYNNLVALRESKSEHLDTMMNLAEKDRNYADQQFDRALNYDMQMLNYRQKFIQNAQDQYSKYDPKQLYSILSTNPRQLAFAEQIMGLGQGGLQKLANAPLSLEDKYKKALTDKIYNDISQKNNPINENGTLNGKPQNASQSSANSYANRLSEANIVIDKLGGNFTGKMAYGGKLPNFLQSGDRQSYEQAKKNFVTAVLRRESGASIAPSEFKTAEEQYFPQAGDRPQVLQQKQALRNTVINNFYKEANVARPVSPGQIIESGGKQYRVGSDGETLEEI